MLYLSPIKSVKYSVRGWILRNKILLGVTICNYLHDVIMYAIYSESYLHQPFQLSGVHDNTCVIAYYRDYIHLLHSIGVCLKYDIKAFDAFRTTMTDHMLHSIIGHTVHKN
jgi:hypothetical protein